MGLISKTQAATLPEGWIWIDCKDGSGSLCDPEGKWVYSYDLNVRIPDDGGVYYEKQGEAPHVYCGTLKEFKNYAEACVLDRLKLKEMESGNKNVELPEEATISKEQLKRILDSYNCNKEDLSNIENYISRNGCLQNGLSEASESFEQGYNNAMEYVFNILGIKY